MRIELPSINGQFYIKFKFAHYPYFMQFNLITQYKTKLIYKHTFQLNGEGIMNYITWNNQLIK